MSEALPSAPALRDCVRPAPIAVPVAFGRRASFWVSAGVVAHTLWTSAAPALAYRLYAAQWHLTPTVTTGLFAIYPIVVVAVLTGFGDLSDHIGRRAAMLLGLGASLLGSLLFAVAPGIVWLFLGRILMGVGVGLSVGAATAAMVEFGPAGHARFASSMTTAAQAFGFATALLLGGALMTYAPRPAHLSFWALSAAVAALFVATWFLPRPPVRVARHGWRMRRPAVPREQRKGFVVASVAVTTAYTHGALVLSLGGQVAHDLVGSANALVNGVAIASFAVLFGIVGIVARPLPPRPAMASGAVVSATGMALLALSVGQHALWLFLGAVATSGTGYSLLFLGGLQVVTGAATARQRGGVVSALFLCAYLSMGVVALLLGAIATAWGLARAVDLGAGAIALLSALALFLVLSVRLSPAPSHHS